MLEKELESKCCKYAKTQGYIAIKLANYGRGSNFLPDRMFLKASKVILVEFKNPNGKGKISLGQQCYFKDLEKQGFKVNIVDDYNKFIGVING